MKWVLSHLSDDHHKWLLQDANEQAQFTYNLQQHSIRIKGKSTRLFFLDVAGFFQKKVILRSEYGVALGDSPVTTNRTEGALSIIDFRAIYQWRQNALLLFDKNRNQLSTVIIEQSESLDKFEQFALLFSHAWIVYSNLQYKKAEDQLVA
jgi:hypothetical protein